MIENTADTPRGSDWTMWLRAAFALAAVAVLAVAFRPRNTVPMHPFSEDAYYALAVARNIALGNGITIDGSMWTNGFQPLFTFLCVPVYWVIEDRVDALRGVHLLQGLIVIASALLFGRLVSRGLGGGGRSREDAQWLGALAWIGSLQILQHSLNGLETPLVLLLYLGVWWVVQGTETWTAKRAAVLGAMAGLLTLARIDGAIFAVILGVGMFLVRDMDWGGRVRNFAIVGCVSAAIASPWFAYNIWLHGSPMPSSGQQTFLPFHSPLNTLMAVAYMAMDLVPTMTAGDYEWRWVKPPSPMVLLPAALRLAVLGALAVFALKWTRVEKSDREVGRDQFFLWMLGAQLAALFCYYGLASLAWWFYERYFIPAAIIGLTVLVRALWVIVGRVDAIKPAAALVFLSITAGTMYSYWSRTGFGGFFYVYTFWIEQVPLVEEHVPEGAVVGARQSGTLGYFRDNVVNLDGKVNHDALEAQEDLLGYVDERGIEWICDWPGMTPWAFQPGDGLPWWEKVDHRVHFGIWRRTDVPLPDDPEERLRMQEAAASEM